MVIHVGGSYLCQVKGILYMGQPEPDPLINHIKAGQPVLTLNVFTVNPHPLISCWVRGPCQTLPPLRR